MTMGLWGINGVTRRGVHGLIRGDVTEGPFAEKFCGGVVLSVWVERASVSYLIRFMRG